MSVGRLESIACSPWPSTDFRAPRRGYREAWHHVSRRRRRIACFLDFPFRLSLSALSAETRGTEPAVRKAQSLIAAVDSRITSETSITVWPVGGSPVSSECWRIFAPRWPISSTG